MEGTTGYVILEFRWAMNLFPFNNGMEGLWGRSGMEIIMWGICGSR